MQGMSPAEAERYLADVNMTDLVAGIPQRAPRPPAPTYVELPGVARSTATVHDEEEEF